MGRHPTTTDAVLGVLEDAGGWITWAELYAALDPEITHSAARSCIHRLTKTGQIERDNRIYGNQYQGGEPVRFRLKRKQRA